MAQYLNPYEGIGNALINIGQNYDLDRRRKREAEEDQKRRRADYLWQSKQEEERANREYERDAPEREMQARIDALRAAELAARTTKAETEARMAAGGRIINLPGGGGSIRQWVDENGNFVEERIPYVSAPDRARAPRPVEGIDPVTGMKSLFYPETGQTTNTGLLASPPRAMSPAEITRINIEKQKAIERIQKMEPKELGVEIRGSTPEERAGGINEASKARQRKIAETSAAYDRMLSGNAQPPTSWPDALMSFGKSVGEGLGRMGVRAGDFSAEEAAIIDQMNSGKLSQEAGAKRLAEITGTPVSLGEGKGATTAPAPKAKEQDITKTPEFKAEKAKLKKQYKDASDAEIEQYLLETWGK